MQRDERDEYREINANKDEVEWRKITLAWTQCEFDYSEEGSFSVKTTYEILEDND